MKLINLLYFATVILVFAAGCRMQEHKTTFSRISIPSAARGAPRFDPKELIHEDVTERQSKFEVSQEQLNVLPADKLVTKAWTALGAGAYDVAIKIAKKVLDRFSEEAKREQDSLEGQFPKSGEEGKYKALNAAGTALYIIAEAYEKQGMCKQALEYYQRAINEFPLSQNWNPRGWYWKVKEEAQAKIKKLKEGNCE